MKKNIIKRRIAAFFGRISIRIASDLSFETQKDYIQEQTRIKIDKWIKEKGWTEDLSQEDVARSLNLKSEQLGQFFYLQTGKSFSRWRRELRIEEAERIMREDRKMPTVLVGESVGIPDKSNFRRQFKEITGYTPAEWRRLEQ
ncbi:MAG: helix-turn-helix domain-containing protein [Bacteroidales bacterium]|nr:helix-turn-helix domain-containing protein [Bacteroidales bacterium]